MAQPPYDPFSTTSMSVPHLTELLARLRDETARRSITIIHASKAEEGEWIFSNAASRLSRSGIRIFGPEPMKAKDLVEQAAHIGAKVIYVGELRREEDARAIRAAATFGIRTVATITASQLEETQRLVEILGPWTGYDIAILG
jgi:stage III sporulation protein SpoIIIAA